MANKTTMARHEFGFEWAQELSEPIVQNLSQVACVEIIPENFFDGRFSDFLAALRAQGTPVAVHGVQLSIGSMEPLKETHLDRVLEVASQVNMVNLSEHLSLTDVDGVDLDALTPLAFTRDVADDICRKIDRIQSRIDVPFLIENVSNRFVIPDTELSETQFINHILKMSGCGLILDITNVYTNSVNFKFDPYRWVDEIDLPSVQLVHLAGGYYDPDGFLMDSHDNKVCDESWDLYRYVVAKAPPFMTIVERTGGFPQFNALNSELAKARDIVDRTLGAGLKTESSLREVAL